MSIKKTLVPLCVCRGCLLMVLGHILVCMKQLLRTLLPFLSLSVWLC